MRWLVPKRRVVVGDDGLERLLLLGVVLLSSFSCGRSS